MHRPIRLLARGDQVQHAVDHGARCLDLRAVVLVGEQVPATTQLLERAEEYLDHPPQPIHLRDEVGWQIETVRDDPKYPVARRPTPVPAACVRFDRHADQPYRMIRPNAVP
jgi:hypothetical protein